MPQRHLERALLYEEVERNPRAAQRHAFEALAGPPNTREESMAYRTAVALALALATASGLAAQSTYSNEPADKTTATGTAKTETAMEGKAIQGGLSVTGTVISSEANRLIVKADNGQQMTFIVNESTADPHLFNVGDRVTASYVTLAGTGPVVTKVISTPAETRASTGTVTYQAPAAKVETTVAPPSATVAVTPPAVTTTTTTQVAETDVDVDNDADNDGVADADEATTLPATASPLPLIALAGFAAGAAGRLVRRFRK